MEKMNRFSPQITSIPIINCWRPWKPWGSRTGQFVWLDLCDAALSERIHLVTIYIIGLYVRVACLLAGWQIPTITFPMPHIAFSMPHITCPIPHIGWSIPNLPSNRDRPSNSTCLMCRSCPKNGRFDFCGINCRDEAKRLSPILLEIPHGHTTFTMGKTFGVLVAGYILTVIHAVQLKFQQSWKPANRTTCPRVKYIYRIVESSNSVASYHNYLFVL